MRKIISAILDGKSCSERAFMQKVLTHFPTNMTHPVHPQSNVIDAELNLSREIRYPVLSSLWRLESQFPNQSLYQEKFSEFATPPTLSITLRAPFTALIALDLASTSKFCLVVSQLQKLFVDWSFHLRRARVGTFLTSTLIVIVLDSRPSKVLESGGALGLDSSMDVTEYLISWELSSPVAYSQYFPWSMVHDTFSPGFNILQSFSAGLSSLSTAPMYSAI